MEHEEGDVDELLGRLLLHVERPTLRVVPVRHAVSVAGHVERRWDCLLVHADVAIEPEDRLERLHAHERLRIVDALEQMHKPVFETRVQLKPRTGRGRELTEQSDQVEPSAADTDQIEFELLRNSLWYRWWPP